MSTPSPGDVPLVGSAWQFFISFPGCIEAFVPKNFFGIRLALNFGEIHRFQPTLQGMFLWSDQLGNFLYHFLGAFKQSCRKVFLVIDELWILEKFNDFNPLSRGCSSGRISLAIFYIISWVHSSNCAVKFFLVIEELWILEKFNDINPLSSGSSSGRISLAIFYIISRVHSSNCAEKFFWYSTYFEFWRN